LKKKLKKERETLAKGHFLIDETNFERLADLSEEH